MSSDNFSFEAGAKSTLDSQKNRRGTSRTTRRAEGKVPSRVCSVLRAKDGNLLIVTLGKYKIVHK